MGIIRDGFVVLRNWATAINKLPEENQLECYKALTEYGLTGKRPEKMSPVVDAMIESFSVGMENAIERYNASVENGKKGGAPLGNQNARKNVDNSKNQNVDNFSEQKIVDNFQKPEDVDNFQDEQEFNQNDFENVDNSPKNGINSTETTKNNQKQPKTSKNNPNVNVNDNVNVFSLSRNNKINNSCGAGAREENVDNPQRAFWKQHFLDFWKFNVTNEERKSLALEVTDVIIDSLSQATGKERLTYNHHKYDYGELFRLFNGLTSEDFGKIVWSLQEAEDIKNRRLYILGALLNKANENKLAEERKHSLPQIER